MGLAEIDFDERRESLLDGGIGFGKRNASEGYYGNTSAKRSYSLVAVISQERRLPAARPSPFT
jgi:hypothetical protein